MIKQIENFVNLHKVRSNFENFLIFQFTQAQGLFDLLLDKNNTAVFKSFDDSAEIRNTLLHMIEDLDFVDGPVIQHDMSVSPLIIFEDITINEFFDFLSKNTVNFVTKCCISTELSILIDSLNNLLAQIDFAIRDNNRKKALENE